MVPLFNYIRIQTCSSTQAVVMIIVVSVLLKELFSQKHAVFQMSNSYLVFPVTQNENILKGSW